MCLYKKNIHLIYLILFCCASELGSLYNRQYFITPSQLYLVYILFLRVFEFAFSFNLFSPKFVLSNEYSHTIPGIIHMALWLLQHLNCTFPYYWNFKVIYKVR